MRTKEEGMSCHISASEGRMTGKTKVNYENPVCYVFILCVFLFL